MAAVLYTQSGTRHVCGIGAITTKLELNSLQSREHQRDTLERAASLVILGKCSETMGRLNITVKLVVLGVAGTACSCQLHVL